MIHQDKERPVCVRAHDGRHQLPLGIEIFDSFDLIICDKGIFTDVYVLCAGAENVRRQALPTDSLSFAMAPR
jgi:hypothetical protein